LNKDKNRKGDSSNEREKSKKSAGDEMMFASGNLKRPIKNHYDDEDSDGAIPGNPTAPASLQNSKKEDNKLSNQISPETDLKPKVVDSIPKEVIKEPKINPGSNENLQKGSKNGTGDSSHGISTKNPEELKQK
jgi:hypothetical protein